jgi:exodeoxyribonuclease VII large subunit
MMGARDDDHDLFEHGLLDDADSDGAGDEFADEPAEHTYSVPEFVDHVNELLRDSFSGMWVTGEIEGWNGRGQHAYFSLVGIAPDGKKAVLNAALFSFNRRRVEGVLQRAGLSLADGVKVRVRGTPDYYGQFGKLSIKVTDIDPRFTLGDLVMAREELVRSLRERGLYDLNRQLDVPVVPLRVGLVTSVGSAAYADFTKEIQSSGLGFDIRVIDCRVQGATAPGEVAAAIDAFGRHGDRDVVVVIRGGGSRTDLAAFDTEEIAQAIARSPLPVFTGIGHEIDTSVADEVAHTRFKTPTATAAGLVALVQEFVEQVEDAWSEIESLAVGHVGSATERLDRTTHSIAQHVRAGVERGTSRLASRSDRLVITAGHVLDRASFGLATAAATLARMPQVADAHVGRLDSIAERLRLLDPATTMARGWSITRTADGRTVRDASDLRVGDVVVTTFQTGTATSRVEETHS